MDKYYPLKYPFFGLACEESCTSAMKLPSVDLLSKFGWFFCANMSAGVIPKDLTSSFVIRSAQE